MSLSSTDIKEIRKFGGLALLIFGALACIGLWREKMIMASILGGFSIVGLGLLLFPRPMRPVYLGWLKITHLIGRGVTIIILTMAYYLVITPSAFLKRLFGGRPLPLNPDKRLRTYWVERPEPAQSKERFLKRY